MGQYVLVVKITNQIVEIPETETTIAKTARNGVIQATLLNLATQAATPGLAIAIPFDVKNPENDALEVEKFVRSLDDLGPRAAVEGPRNPIPSGPSATAIPTPPSPAGADRSGVGGIIDHTPITQSEEGRALPVRATISCPSDRHCDGTLYYRRSANYDWDAVPMTALAPSRDYVATLPPQAPGALYYFIQVDDNADPLATDGTSERPHTIAVNLRAASAPEAAQPLKLTPEKSAEKRDAPAAVTTTEVTKEPVRVGTYSMLALSSIAAVAGAIFTARTYNAAASARGCVTVESCSAGISRIKEQDNIMWGAWASTGVFGAASALFYLKSSF